MQTRTKTAIIVTAAVIAGIIIGGLAVLYSLAWMGSKGPGDNAESPRTELNHTREIELIAALEEVRAKYRDPAGKIPDRDELIASAEKTLAENEKKERLLGEMCNIEITPQMVEDEVERMMNDYRRPLLMREIAAALEDDPEAIVEIWVKPILIDRYLRACFLTDPDINREARQSADDLREKLLSGDTSGATPASVPVSEVKAWAGDTPTAGDVGPLEDMDYNFRVMKVMEVKGDTVEVLVHEVDKPDFDKWFLDH